MPAFFASDLTKDRRKLRGPNHQGQPASLDDGTANTSRISRMPQSSFLTIPQAIERWTRLNAWAALLGAAASVAVSSLLPSLCIAIVSIAWCCFRYAPRMHSGGVGVANLITTGRLGALAAVMIFMPQTHAWVASTAGLVYTFDGVDGWIARRRGEASSFGATFDMETDAYTVILLSTYLIVERDFGVWVLAFGAIRYVYVLARAAAVSREVPIRDRRSTWGRWVYTFVLVGLTIACVPAWNAVAVPLLAATLVLLAFSFAPDFAALIPRS